MPRPLRNDEKPKSVRERVKKHREALRHAGMRPIQIWVPDTSRKDFQAECRRQSSLIKNDSQEKEILDWMEDATDYEGWK